jgi:Tol biopolymer transport system component
MTPDRDVQELLDRWLAEGPTRVSDRAFDQVVGRVHAQRQRAAWRFLRREPTMISPLRFVLVAAAVIAAVAVGTLLVSSLPSAQVAAPRGGTLTPPSSAPSPSEEASANPATTLPLGLALVDLQGTVQEDLQLPLDAWVADLSVDGRLAFLTQAETLGFCGQCGRLWRIAIVDTTTGSSGYLLGPDVDRVQGLAWSPDGTQLAFTDDDGTGNIDVYVVDVESGELGAFGGDIRRLTTDPAIDEFPAWTPDGSAIVYDNVGSGELDDSGFARTQEIWTVPVDGGDPVRLTTNDVWDAEPDVAPDGTIVFIREGRPWTMTISGTEQRALESIAGGFSPRWSPDGSRLALLQHDGSARAHLPAELGHGTDLPLLRVVIVDVATQGVTNTHQRVVSDLNPASWTRDGGGLLINRYDEGG